MLKKLAKITVASISLFSIGILHTNSILIDTETSSNNFTAGSWKVMPQLLLTEIYFDVDTSSKGSEPSGEWIEIYNTTNQEINFKNWSISDNAGTLAYLSDAIIPSRSFAVITSNENFSSYWTLPNDAVLITSSEWVRGLNNSGDKVVLKSPTGITIDSLSYGNNTDVFDPAVNPIHDGKTISRTNVLVDTDTAADFTSSTPTPGL